MVDKILGGLITGLFVFVWFYFGDKGLQGTPIEINKEVYMLASLLTVAALRK